MHCAVQHWSRLSIDNELSARGWTDYAWRFGARNLSAILHGMLNGERPIEKGAIVVAGSLHPKDLEFRGWLKRRIKGAHIFGTVTVSLIYAMGPHLDHDEDLVDWLSLRMFRLPKIEAGDSTRLAINDVVTIWSTAKGSGTCEECRKRKANR